MATLDAPETHNTGTLGTRSAHFRPAVPRVLSIAGTDPTGGAGIQADLKSIMAAGGYGMSVITSLVAQNTQGVRTVHTPPLEFLDQQLAAVFDDVTVDAIKIGMLATPGIIEVVTQWLQKIDVPLVVLDPVMVAASGDLLQSADALDALRTMLPFVDVVTPNVPELALLAGVPEPETMKEAIALSASIVAEYNLAVIAKGGHVQDADAGNAVVQPSGEVFFVSSPRVETSNTHGTGCSLSSALATRLAHGEDLPAALTWSTRWLRDAIVAADELRVGKGHGPVDHGHRMRYLAEAAQRGSQLGNLALPVVGEEGAFAPLHSPAGPHTQGLWDAANDILASGLSADTISRMCNSCSERTSAAAFLGQTRLLRSAMEKCMESADAASAISGEVATPITSDAINFLALASTAAAHPDAVIANLGVRWILVESALRVTTTTDDDHPLHSWAQTFTHQHFRDSLTELMKDAERILAGQSPEQTQRRQQIFRQTCHHLFDFLDQPYRRW